MMQNKALYAVVFSLLFGLGVVVFKATNNEYSEAPKPASMQTPFAYSVALKRAGYINKNVLQTDSKDTGKLEVASHLTGTLNLKVIEENNDGRLLFGQFSQLHHQPNKALEALFSQPFAFYIKNNGAIELYEKNISYAADTKNMLLQVLHYFQVITESPSLGESSQQWQTKETDLIGDYIADYSVVKNAKPRTLKKQKSNYSHINALPAVFSANSLQADIMQHNSSFIIDNAAPLPINVIASEQIELRRASEFVSDVAVTFTAQITSIGKDIRFPQSLAELEQQLLLSTTENPINLYAISPDLSALSQGKNPDELLSLFLETYALSPSKARQLVINYLRQHPEKSKAFVDTLYEQRKQLTDEEEVRLWALLAKAGHKEAQQAYIYALSNPDFEQVVQYRAISHVRFFKQPSAEFVEGLWQVQANLSNATSGNYRDNKTLSSAALLALGTLTTSDSIDTEVKNTILATLDDRLSSETDTMEVSALITAAGNTKNPELLDSITPYLQDENSQLKEKAFIAIARIPGDKSQTHLIQAYETLHSSEQKLQFVALDSLNKMPMTKESLSWVSDKALELNNPTESVGLIRILGNHRDTSPTAELTFRNILAQDPSINIKSEIYRFISPSENHSLSDQD